MDGLTTLLEELENAQLVGRAADEEQSYLFRHVLTQEVAYDSLLLKRRRDVHRLVAAAIERVYPGSLDQYAALLARHYQAAGDDPKMASYAMRAGDNARRLNAEPEARMHYALALEALSRLPETDENRRASIDALLSRTAVSFTSDAPEENLEYLREAESLVHALLQAAGSLPADRLRLARVRAWSARMHFLRGERRMALQEFEEVLPVARELGDEALVSLASSLIARNRVWDGDFRRAQPLLEQALPSLEQREDWTDWILCRSILGLAQAAQGDYRSALAQARMALAKARDLDDMSGMAIGHSVLSLIHLMGGAIRPMLEASRAAVQPAASSGNRLALYNALSSGALAESRLGRHQAARESIAQAEAAARGVGGRAFLEDWVAAFKVEMALNAGEIEETLTRAEEALTQVRSVDGRFAEAMLRKSWGRALGALKPPRWDEAEAHFAASLQLLEAGGAVLEAARTRVAWGQLLRARGDHEGAQLHFKQAAAQFERSGLLGELEQTARLIKAPAA